MRKTHWCISAALVAAVVAAPSEACRLSQTPAQKLESGYKNNAITSVAIVRVTGSAYINLPSGETYAWSASAAVQRLVRGSYSAPEVTFKQNLYSCDVAYPMAKAGDFWVVYLSKGSDGLETVWAFYPADVAYVADPFYAADSLIEKAR